MSQKGWKDFGKFKARLLNFEPGNKGGTIGNFKICYWENPEGSPQEFILPFEVKLPADYVEEKSAGLLWTEFQKRYEANEEKFERAFLEAVKQSF